MRPSHSSCGSSPAASNASNRHEVVLHIQSQSGTDADDTKRKPGRPRGSRNRKPKTSSSSTFSVVTTPAPKPPPNTYHPGFYQYPPAPGNNVNPNQQFYEFQWRALNLCSEFYNAAEELVVSTVPHVSLMCLSILTRTFIESCVADCHCPMLSDGSRGEGRSSGYDCRSETRVR